MDICLATYTPASGSGDESGEESDADSSPDLSHSLQSPGDSISEEEAQMAVALTEYFQEQRRVYEHVCCLSVCVHVRMLPECVCACVYVSCSCCIMCVYVSVL